MNKLKPGAELRYDEIDDTFLVLPLLIGEVVQPRIQARKNGDRKMTLSFYRMTK
jgi:hypothetical protein